jgi:anti-anti-sigma regulatory factor
MRVPSESFSVLVEESNDALHVFLGGWFDAAAVPGLYQAVARSGSRDVVLDIEDLEFIDGAGWLGVIGCEQRVAIRGGRLRIERHPEDPRTRSRHFSIAGTVIA